MSTNSTKIKHTQSQKDKNIQENQNRKQPTANEPQSLNPSPAKTFNTKEHYKTTSSACLNIVKRTNYNRRHIRNAILKQWSKNRLNSRDHKIVRRAHNRALRNEANFQTRINHSRETSTHDGTHNRVRRHEINHQTQKGVINTQRQRTQTPPKA